jgi:hypothetical protein
VINKINTTRSVLLILVAMLTVSIIPLNHARAEAPIAPWIAEASTERVSSWLWADAVKNTGDSNFNYETSSYIIFQKKLFNDYKFAYPVNYNVDWSQYYIVYAPVGKKLSLSIANYSTFGSTLFIQPTAGSTLKHGTINVNSPKYLFPDNRYLHGMNYQASTDISTPIPFPILSSSQWSDSQAIDYVVAQRNLEYAPSFTALSTTFTNTVNQNEYNGSTSEQCGTLDIVCNVKKITSGMANTLQSAVKSIIDFIVSIFWPTQSVIEDKLLTIRAIHDESFGFMGGVLSFMGNFVNALTSSAYDTTCTPTSCPKTFGNFYGQPFTIDFATPGKVMPSLFSWFRGMLIAVTAISVIFMYRRKYLELIGGH